MIKENRLKNKNEGIEMIEPRISAMWEPPIILEKDMPEEIVKTIKEMDD